MKFTQEEHDAFKKEIIASGKEYHEFSFTKKKGWLSINHPNSSNPFLYHRKSETQITIEGQWVEHEKYFSEMNNNKEEYSDFQKV
ncbi:MAG: hypothetical protein ACI8U0_002875, partial [Flavobacteriales bacterium]